MCDPSQEMDSSAPIFIGAFFRQEKPRRGGRGIFLLDTAYKVRFLDVVLYVDVSHDR